MNLEELVAALGDLSGEYAMASVRINSEGMCFLSFGLSNEEPMDIYELEEYLITGGL